MSEIDEEPDTGGEGEVDPAVAQSESFLGKALEKAGAERDESVEEPRSPRQAAPQAPAAPREKSAAQIRFEERLALRVQAREQAVQRQVLAKIAAALEPEDEPDPKVAAGDDDPEPDPEIDWRGWNAWNRRQTVRAVQDQIAPIQAFFGTLTEQQQRQQEEQRQADAQIEQFERTREYLAAETQEYEKIAPGYMERVNSSFTIHLNSLLQAGFQERQARHIAGTRLMEIMAAGGRQSQDPFETLDRFVSAELRSLGYQVPAASGRPNAEIAQRVAAARAPVAGSLGQGGSPKGPQSAAGGSGALSKEQLIARAKKKWGKDWRAHVLEIAGQAAAGVAG